MSSLYQIFGVFFGVAAGGVLIQIFGKWNKIIRGKHLRRPHYRPQYPTSVCSRRNLIFYSCLYGTAAFVMSLSIVLRSTDTNCKSLFLKNQKCTVGHFF